MAIEHQQGRRRSVHSWPFMSPIVLPAPRAHRAATVSDFLVAIASPRTPRTGGGIQRATAQPYELKR